MMDVFITDEIVNEFLRQGGNRKNSRFRIIYNFMTQKTEEEQEEYIKNEYDSGGRGLIINGQKYSAWWDLCGMKINLGETAENGVFFSWGDITKRIQTLLLNGIYASQEELDQSKHNAVTEAAWSFAYMCHDMEQNAFETYFSDVQYVLDYNKLVEKLKVDFLNQKTLSIYLKCLNNAENEYNENPEIMRFHYHNPKKVSKKLCYLLGEQKMFFAKKDWIPTKPDAFITQDEIDQFLRNGSSDKRLDIYVAFSNAGSEDEKAEKLKKVYGTGGRSHALSGADDSRADYNGKGLKLERGNYGNPYASVFLKWIHAAKRIQFLIDNELFLNNKDKENKTLYEQKQIVRKIILFYYRLPKEIQRPFKEDFFNEEAREDLLQQLQAPRKTKILRNKITEDFAKLPKDFAIYNSNYEEKSKLYYEIILYCNGEYSIYPKKEKEGQMNIFDYL